MTNVWHLGFFVSLCCAVFFSDLLFRRVPNILVLLALLVQAGFLFFSQELPTSLASEWRPAALGLVIGFLIFIPFYAFRAMGAGDVKFFALLGFWMGPAALTPVWLAGSLLAGAHAMVIIAGNSPSLWWVRERGLSALSRLRRFSCWRAAVKYVVGARRGRFGIPYAAYLAVAAVGFLVWTD